MIFQSNNNNKNNNKRYNHSPSTSHKTIRITQICDLMSLSQSSLTERSSASQKYQNALNDCVQIHRKARTICVFSIKTTWLIRTAHNLRLRHSANSAMVTWLHLKTCSSGAPFCLLISGLWSGVTIRTCSSKQGPAQAVRVECFLKPS